MAHQQFKSILENDEWSFDPIQKVWSGPKKPLKYGPDCSLGQILLKKLLEKDDHICLLNCDTGKQYTNREVSDMAINIARHFKKLGYKQGDIVGFCGVNTDYLGPLVIGILLEGLIVNALEPTIGLDGVKHIFSITKPSIIICDGNQYDKIKIALQEIDLKIPVYTMVDHIPGVPEITEFLQGKGSQEFFEPAKLINGYLQIATIQSSSGTSGPPKAINVTHATLMNCHSIQYSQENDRFLNFTTLNWVVGVYSLSVPILGNSTRLITSKPFDVDLFFDIVNNYKPTVISLPPSYLQRICASPKIKTTNLSSIIRFFCGGSPLNPSVVTKIRQYMPYTEIMNSYGMTESPLLRIALGYASDNGGIGKLTNNTQIKITDNEGNNLGPYESGELWVKTLLPFTGYHKNPEANAKIHVDGWVRTSDIGFMDDDGNLNISDRKQDVIKFNGIEIFPSDIENVILEMQEIADVSVAALQSIKPKLIPAIVVLVLKPGFSISEDAVYEFVSKKIPHFGKLEGGIHFVNEIPKTATGKNLRNKIQFFVTNNPHF